MISAAPNGRTKQDTPDTPTPERRGALEETAGSGVSHRLKAAVRIPLVLMAVALPIALATPAQATTVSASAAKTSAGCGMTVHNPDDLSTSFPGSLFPATKRVAYKVTINCPGKVPPGVYVQVQQRFFEQDAGPDERVGSETNFQILVVGGNHTFNVTRNVPNTEAGREELYQKARFYAVGVPVPPIVAYGPWVASGVTSIVN